MTTKKEARLLAQNEPQPLETTISIDAAPQPVNTGVKKRKPLRTGESSCRPVNNEGLYAAIDGEELKHKGGSNGECTV